MSEPPRAASRPRTTPPVVVEDAYQGWLWIEERASSFPAVGRRYLGHRMVDAMLDVVASLTVRPYLRYMDDLLFFDDDAGRLRDHAAALAEACERLRLRVHPWQVAPTQGGVGYLGFRILPRGLRVKRSSVNRARARRWRIGSTATRTAFG